MLKIIKNTRWIHNRHFNTHKRNSNLKQIIQSNNKPSKRSLTIYQSKISTSKSWSMKKLEHLNSQLILGKLH